MKRNLLLALLPLVFCINLNGQINCDSCLALKDNYMSNGSIESYDIYWKFCEEIVIDTIYLDSNNQIKSKSMADRYMVVKVDKCLNHKFYYTYNIFDNKVISTLEIYFNDTVCLEPEKYPICTEKYVENHDYYSQGLISESTQKYSTIGNVFLEFLILKNGKIDCVKISKGADKYLNADALRFVSNMPYWLPGINNDKKVICKGIWRFKYQPW